MYVVWTRVGGWAGGIKVIEKRVTCVMGAAGLGISSGLTLPTDLGLFTELAWLLVV